MRVNMSAGSICKHGPIHAVSADGGYLKESSLVLSIPGIFGIIYGWEQSDGGKDGVLVTSKFQGTSLETLLKMGVA